MQTIIKPPLTERQLIWMFLGSVTYATCVFKAPFTGESWSWAQAFRLSVLLILPTAYISHKQHRKRYFTKLMPPSPLLPAPTPTWLSRNEFEDFKRNMAEELANLRNAVPQTAGNPLDEEIVLKALEKFFPQGWQALNQRPLLPLMMLNETQAALILGLKPKTLRNERNLNGGPPRYCVGRKVGYRLGDLLDYLKDKRVEPFR